MQKPTLAIVIPAYKHQFLRETLESIAGQTCKDFNLYIGDDGSPNPIEEIVEEFRGRLDFVYKRFDENLGGKSLVGHWRRCIEMTRGEEWLMILGDDDTISSNYVSSFYDYLPKINELEIRVIRYSSKLFHQDRNSYSEVFKHPEIELTTEAFCKKIKDLSRSSLSEHIFRLSDFKKIGFNEFPLGWYSDDLAWLEFSGFGYVYSINEGLCTIGRSEASISGNTSNLKSKIKASETFFKILFFKHLNKFSLKCQKDLILFYRTLVLKRLPSSSIANIWLCWFILKKISFKGALGFCYYLVGEKFKYIINKVFG